MDCVGLGNVVCQHDIITEMGCHLQIKHNQFTKQIRQVDMAMTEPNQIRLYLLTFGFQVISEVGSFSCVAPRWLESMSIHKASYMVL